MAVRENELKERLIDVQNRICKAAKKSGRKPDEIKLVAVGKNHSLDKIKFFRKNGVKLFGENRVQELMEKNEDITGDFNWHFIGHLQRNKVKYLMRMDNCKLIHSLDSMRLAREINKRAGKNNRTMPVLVEVNVSGDGSKYGFKTGEVLNFLKKAAKFTNIEIKGLMTIVPYVDDPEEVRPYFRELAELKEEINAEGFNLKELSMGMTNDFEVAIEEGATMVRIGTALFGQRQY